MKKGNAVLLAFLLLISCFSPIRLMANTVETTKLPEVGQVINGFKLIEVGEMELAKGKTLLFRHEQSGATLFCILNNDKNRVFDISFKTPVLDNTGVNHVLEHITCSGSNKYPLRDVAFAIAHQTYTSDINAMTTNTMTTYPVSSMSEDQLLKLADIYMDCAFNPNLLTEPNLFKREGWRYEKNGEEDRLRVTGIVYSEMKGYGSNIDYAAQNNVFKALFPHTSMSNNSGGDTSYMTDLTYEKVLETHDRFYNPSNSLIVLYGDINYQRFLEHLDKEYLSKYKDVDQKIDYGEEPAFSKMALCTYDFPVSKESVDSGVCLDYAYAMTGISIKDGVGIDLICRYLNQSNSSLQKAFKLADIGKNLSVYYSGSLPQPILCFSVTHADKTKAERFKALIDEEMERIITEHFDGTMIDALVTNIEFNNSLATENINLGFNIAISIAQMWSVSDDFEYYNNFFENIREVKEESKKGYLEALIKKYIIGNTHSALVVTIPKPGLLEENIAKEEAKLEAYEAGLSIQEKANLVMETRSFNKWNEKEDSPELIQSLQGVNIDDIEINIANYEIIDIQKNGVRYVSALANVGDTIYPALMLDTSTVKVEDLHYLELYTNLLGRISTKRYSAQELETQMTRYLNGFDAYTTTWFNKNLDDHYKPVLMLEWLGKASENAKSMSLMKEILFETRLDNTEELLDFVKQTEANYLTYYNGSPLSIGKKYNSASRYLDSSYEVYMHEIAYYNFLKKIEIELEQHPEQVIKSLKQVKELILNQTNLIVLLTSSRENKGCVSSQLQNLIQQLPKRSIKSEDYSCLPIFSNKLGIEVDTTMNYNILSASYNELGTSYSGKYIPLMLVISENYLTPKLRYQNNVYTNQESVSMNGITMITYMDPYIRETHEVYDQITDFINTYDLSEESLKGYIASALTNYTLSTGELLGATKDLYAYLCGYDKEEEIKTISEIKHTTVKDFKEMAKLFIDICTKGSWTTIANKDNLEKNKGLFEQTLSLQNAENMVSKMQYVTKGEFIELVLGDNLYDQACLVGIISGKEDELISMEEAVIGIYKILEIQGIDVLLPQGKVKISNAASLSTKGVKALRALLPGGFISLNQDNYFDATKKVTIGQLVSIVTKITDYLENYAKAA